MWTGFILLRMESKGMIVQTGNERSIHEVTGSSLTSRATNSFSKKTLLHGFSKSQTIPLKAVETYGVGKSRGSHVF